MVSVLVDGKSVAEAQAAGSGAFALLFTLVANDKPSVMMLEAILADGRQVFSGETIALAPIVGPSPVDVASAEAAAPPAAVVVTEDTVTVIQPGTEAATAPEEVATALEAEPTPTPDPAGPLQEVATATTVSPTVAVVIDAISYNAAGDVLLSGKGQVGHFIRLYLDNVLTETVEVNPSGAWQVTLVDTVPGIYTLRVDQVDGGGKVSARFETPFQRETRERLAALAQGGAPEKAEASETAPVTEKPAPKALAADATVVDAPVAKAPDALPLQVEASTSQTETKAGEGSGGLTTEAKAAPEASSPEPTTAETVRSEPTATETVTSEPTTTTQATSDTAAAAPVSTGPQAPAPQATAADAPQEALAVVAEPVPPALPALDQPGAQPLGTTFAGATPSSASPPTAVAQPQTDSAPGAVPATVSITVQPGYTLWGIARASLGDGVLYVQVYNANKDKIKDPDLIYPGQVFTLPVQQ